MMDEKRINISMNDKFRDKISKRFNDIIANSNPDLVELREKAFRRFSEMGLPNAKFEDWKYTSLNFLNKYNFEFLAEDTGGNFDDEVIKRHIPDSLDANILVFLNGELSHDYSRIDSGSGLFVNSIRNKLDKLSNGFLNLYSTAHSQSNPISMLNTSIADKGCVITIDDNIQISKPFYLLFLSSANNKDVFIPVRNLIQIGRNSRASFIFQIHGYNGNASFTSMVNEFFLSENAHMEFISYQNDTGKVFNITDSSAILMKDSTIDTTNIFLDGKFSRNDVLIKLRGENAEAHLYGLYLSSNDNFIDNHTVVDHETPHCNSNELYKGVLDDSSKGVFSGRIIVREDAQKTNAYQSNKNILLSNDATMNTKPQLEIYADDVKCSHGATSGNLDKEQLFYLISRGISPDLAKSLLLKAFTNEIIEHISDKVFKNFVESEVEKKLNLLHI